MTSLASRPSRRQSAGGRVTRARSFLGPAFHEDADVWLAESRRRPAAEQARIGNRSTSIATITRAADLAEFSVYHLNEKAATGEYQQRWLDKSETYLTRAVAFFTRYQRATEKDREPDPCPRNLATIGVPDIRQYHEWLKTQSNGRGELLGRGSRRHP